MTQSNADQIAYWNGEAGKRWTEQQTRLDAMLSPLSDAILATAAAKPGENVLDVGCGCGATSLELAKAVAPRGSVFGIDISGPMLARARIQAASNPSVTFPEADAATHAFSPNSIDLLFSRFGVMFFSAPGDAFANMRKALSKGGRLAFVCWRDWRENEWVRIPVKAIRPHLPPQPQLGPEDPGPFSFADPSRIRRILAEGGFDAITLKPFDTKLQVGSSRADAAAHLQEFGPVARALTDATAEQRHQAAAALDDALSPYADSGLVVLGAAVWLVTAKV